MDEQTQMDSFAKSRFEVGLQHLETNRVEYHPLKLNDLSVTAQEDGRIFVEMRQFVTNAIGNHLCLAHGISTYWPLIIHTKPDFFNAEGQWGFKSATMRDRLPMVAFRKSEENLKTLEISDDSLMAMAVRRTRFFGNEDGLLEMAQEWWADDRANVKRSRDVFQKSTDEHLEIARLNGPLSEVAIWDSTAPLYQASQQTLPICDWGMSCDFDELAAIYNMVDDKAKSYHLGKPRYQAHISYFGEMISPVVLREKAGQLRLIIQASLGVDGFLALELAHLSVASRKRIKDPKTGLYKTRLDFEVTDVDGALTVYTGQRHQ